MTPRERWQAMIDGRPMDRVPCDYWGTAEITRQLLADLQCRTEREMWDALGIDKCIFLAPPHPRATEDTWHMPSLFSIWNVETIRIPYLDGLGYYEEAVNPPFAEFTSPADLDAFPWPRPEDWDFSGYREQCLQWRDHPIVGASYEPFYQYCRLRGMDRALEDLVMNPELFDAAMERFYHLYSSLASKALDIAGDLITFIYVAEDLGTQSSLLMSPTVFRRRIKPWLKKMIDLVHARGALAFHHDDGAIRPVLPDLLEIGIDVLNPIQWRCKGMEREALAADFGRSLIFHGGVDNQHTLPFGTPEDVKQQVRDNIRIFRECKGYVVAPCHNIQANTPTANVVAMYQAVHEHGQRD
ncbi:MAG: uroporphyrinogen-III decarboxylase-like protein [Acidobacteria bacterium]|nr:uroporphyrinogen-III decarboxylase-like protein [Acidobacteriota bacterium]